MKLTCFILIIVLMLGYTAKMLAQKNDSIPFSFDMQRERLETNMPAPEIYSFIERVRLWNYLFAEEEITNNSSDFRLRIRNEIREQSIRSFNSTDVSKKWNWKVTNLKKIPKCKGTTKREKKDYMLAIINPYIPPYEIYGVYDWTVNNKNPFQRQQVRMNLIEFPRLYFFIQMLKFINILDSFIREVPTHYDINEQWRISYRSDKLVFTYTY